MMSPAVETCRRKLFDMYSIPKWFGERRECNSGGAGRHVRLQFTRMRNKYLRNMGKCTHEDVRHNTLVLFPSSSCAQISTGNLWSARFTVQTWAVKEGLRPAVSFMIDENIHGFDRWQIRQFQFRESYVICPLLSLVNPAPSCDNRGSVWLGLGARDLSGSSPCSSTAPSLFLALDKTTRIHNKPSGHQVSVCHDCLGPCHRGYKPAVLKLHVCWPDASVVADL